MKTTIGIPTLTQIKAERCRRNFFYFVQTFWSVNIVDEPVWNWHIPYLCSELQLVAERVINNEPKLYDLIINVPPGTSKSTLVTIMLPAWMWIREASSRILTVSYSGGLSVDHSVKSRDIIKSELFKRLFPEIQIRKDIDGKMHFENTDKGSRYSTSISGTITGKHGNLLVIDDPLNPKGAASDADRESTNYFMDATLPTRKVNKEVAVIILVMQRLHQNDPTGHWLERRDNIKHICIPAELSPDVKPVELREMYVDGLMDPVRLSRRVLDDMKQSLGTYGYSGQIMQTPTPLDGAIWKLGWIIPIDDVDIPKDLEHIGSDWDLAYTKYEGNSSSAYVTAGRKNNNMYILDLDFKWLEFPSLINWMKLTQAPHYIEGKASGKSAKQVLNNSGILASEVSVTGGDKIARATLATPYAESGFVYCRRKVYEKLLYDGRQGILVFPNGDGDDLQDALVQSINRLLAKPPIEIRGSRVY